MWTNSWVDSICPGLQDGLPGSAGHSVHPAAVSSPGVRQVHRDGQESLGEGAEVGYPAHTAPAAHQGLSSQGPGALTMFVETKVVRSVCGISLDLYCTERSQMVERESWTNVSVHDDDIAADIWLITWRWANFYWNRNGLLMSQVNILTVFWNYKKKI